MNIGLLAVSFGTTHLDTLERTILAAEADLSAAFPQLPCYRAFTSAVVRRRLAGRMAVDGVEEALARMAAGGLEGALVQPTLLIPGEEYDRLRARIPADGRFALGDPLLRDEADLAAMAAILREAYPLDKDTVLLAMGHGTTHSANGLYLRLARHMAPDMALCTVEGRPSFREAVDALLAQPRRKVHLVPLLLVAGDHSKNDMAGPGPDSLRSLLERAGFQVSWSLRGLGELPAVRRRFVLRAREAYEAAGFCGAPAD